MKLLVPALLLLTTAASANLPPAGGPVGGDFQALYDTARTGAARLFEGGDKSLAAKAPQVMDTLATKLPKEPLQRQAAGKKLLILEQSIDQAIGIQQGVAVTEAHVKEVARALGADPEKAWAKYREAAGGGPGQKGARPNGSVLTGENALRAQNAISRASLMSFGPNRQVQALSDATSVSARYRPTGLVNFVDPNASRTQLPQSLSTTFKEPPKTGVHEKKEEKKGWLDGYKGWWEETGDHFKEKAKEQRLEDSKKLAEAMKPETGWWEAAKLRASAAAGTVKEYGYNLAAGDGKTWRNTAIVVGGVAAAVVAAPVVVAMATGATAVTAGSVATLAVHAGLAGLTYGGAVATGNELLREPSWGHAGLFALSVAPVGKLEKVAHAVVSSKAVDAVAAYAGKLAPVVSDAIKTLPGATKVVEALGSTAKVIKGSEAAVKVAEVTGEVMEHNGAHMVHHTVQYVAEHSGEEPLPLPSPTPKTVPVMYHMQMTESR